MSISPSHNRTPSPTAPSEDGRRSEKTNRLTAEFLQAEYVQGQKSILTIAEECQVDPGTVRRKLRAAGIPARSAQEANSRSYASDPPKSVLVESYSERQLSINQIAQELGIKSARVGYLLRTFEIPRRTAHQGQRLAAGLQIEKKLTSETLYELYAVQRLSIGEIARQYQCLRRTVRNQLHSLGLPTRSVKEASLLANGSKLVQGISKEQWIELYALKQLNCEFLGKTFGVSPNTVRRCLKDHNIPLRTKSESVRIARQTPGTQALTPQLLTQRYVVSGESCARIGKIIGVDTSTVRNYLIRYGIPVRNPTEARALRPNAEGGSSVNPYFATPIHGLSDNDSQEIRLADTNTPSAVEQTAASEELAMLEKAMRELRSVHPESFFLLSELFGLHQEPKSGEELDVEHALSQETRDSIIETGLTFLRKRFTSLPL